MTHFSRDTSGHIRVYTAKDTIYGLKHRPTHYTYRILLVTENPGREAPSAHSSVDVNVREGLNLCSY